MTVSSRSTTDRSPSAPSTRTASSPRARPVLLPTLRASLNLGAENVLPRRPDRTVTKAPDWRRGYSLPTEHSVGLILLPRGGELLDEFRIAELGALLVGAGALPLDRLLQVRGPIARLGGEIFQKQRVIRMLLDPIERLDDGRLLLARIAKRIAVEVGTGQLGEILHRLARRRKLAGADVEHVFERDVARPGDVEPEHGVVAQADVIKPDRQHHHRHRRDRAGVGFDGVARRRDVAPLRRRQRMIEPAADLDLRAMFGRRRKPIV